MNLHGRRLAGTAIPLSALHSEESCGIGEFYDLVPFGRYASNAGLNIIQLLPINDSGAAAAPYSALSANALSPAYIRLSRLENWQKLPECPQGERVLFSQVYRLKMQALREYFTKNKKSVLRNDSFESFRAENTWLKEYSVFMVLRLENGERHWKEWEHCSICTRSAIEKIESEKQDEVLFHAWVQYVAYSQLMEAVQELSRFSVALKGDVPILMSEDSADVWAFPNLFRMDVKAGAPPDMFSTQGQNWGFPVYNWEQHGKTDFFWWKQRMSYASRFFDAVRIDHVLGFFRIYQIPAGNRSGVLGYFSPFEYITRRELHDAGFNDARIAWLSKAHIPAQKLEWVKQNISEKDFDYLFERVGNEELYQFSSGISGEETIYGMHLLDGVRDAILSFFQDIALVQVEDSFFPAWYASSSSAYASLSGEEKERLDRLTVKKYEDSENEWEKQAEKILYAMKSSSSILFCAEDLGAVPACVAPVLERLGILSLRVERWARDYHQAAAPFAALSHYPVLSVATSSVHDSSTLRGWWEEEQDKKLYAEEREYDYSESLNNALSRQILSGLYSSSSRLVILPFQDLMAAVEGLSVQSSREERINIPGTVADSNWSWRLPYSVEQLESHSDFEVLAALLRDWSKMYQRELPNYK